MTSVFRPRPRPRLFYTWASQRAVAVLPEHRSQGRAVRRLHGRATRGGLLNQRPYPAGMASRRTSVFRRRRGFRLFGVLGKDAYPGEALEHPPRCAQGRDPAGQAGLRLRPDGIESATVLPLAPGAISSGGVLRLPGPSCCARKMRDVRYRRALLHDAAGDLHPRALPDPAPCSNGVRPRGAAYARGPHGRAPCSTPARPRGWRADLGPRGRDALRGCADRVFQKLSRPSRSGPAAVSFREQVRPAEPPIHPSAGTRRRFIGRSSLWRSGLSAASGFRRR